MSGETVNYKAVAFYILIIFVVAVVILYFLPLNPNPIHAAISNVLSWISSTVGKLGGGSIGQLISKNWTYILGIGVTVIPLAYTTVKSYLDKATATKALQAAQDLAVTKENSAKTMLEQAKTAKDAEIQTLKDKLSTYENDPALSSLQTSYSTLQTEKTKLQGQIDLLNQKLEAEIQNRPVITKTQVK
jgi:hypothetical protein